MRRRDFLAAATAAAAWPGIAAAQRSLLPVAGFLGVLSAADVADLVAAFQRGMNEMGFVDGTNVVVEARWAESQPDRLPALASELIRHRAAVVVATGSGASAIAAKGPAAGVIPMVFIEGDLDPVKAGLVKSLDKPDGAITGVLLSSPNLLSKRLETLLEAAADPDVIAMLVNPKTLSGDTEPSQALGIAASLGRKLQLVNATNEDEIDAAFAGALVKPQVGAVLVADDLFFLTQRDRIVAAAANNAIPTMYPHPAFVLAGGLMSYNADMADAYRHAGDITANILLGKKPAEIPVRQPTKFELVFNRKTATAQQIPVSVVNTANRVTEGSNPNEASPIWIPGTGAPRPPGQ